MSNKVKLANQSGVKRTKLKKVQRPVRIGFKYHLGDTAGCGYIRCIFPSLLLNNMVTKDMKIEAFYTNLYTPMPQAYSATNFAIFQRSATPEQLRMIQHFKAMRAQHKLNTAIIYEIDDNLFDIPDWNFAKGFYVKHKETAQMILRECDGITTSTDFLKKEYEKYNKNVIVNENHLPRFLWGKSEFQPQDNKKIRILYAGSMNHFDVHNQTDQGDMETKLIDYVIKTKSKFDWHFVGGIPHRLKVESNSGSITYHEWQNIMTLPQYLRDIKADISIAPLENNRFNMSKSNIKALEGLAIGVPMVCSDVGPYKGQPGNASTADEMISRIEELAGDIDKRKEQWYNMHEHLKGQLFWEENGNVEKYINNHLRLIKMRL